VLRDTEPASLMQLYSLGLGNRNRLDALATAVAGLDQVDEVALANALKAADVVDEAEIIRGVLAGMPAADARAFLDALAAELTD
jgi:hypothetical protein